MICRNETTESYLAAHRSTLEMLRQPNETPDTQLPEDYSPRSISFACSDINDTEISSCESIAIYNVRPSFTGSLPIRIVLHSQDAANSYSFDGFLTLTNS